jgi:hypothetical protein
VATKKKQRKSVKKRKSPVTKKPVKKTLVQKKKSRIKQARSAKSLFKKRSQAAKKGWVTRRKLSVSKKDRHHLIKTIKELEEKLKIQEGYTEQYLKRYQQEIAMDNLPARMIFETATEHAGRIVKALKLRGYNADQAYAQVASHTGLAPREVYSLFLYVGPGEYVA